MKDIPAGTGRWLKEAAGSSGRWYFAVSSPYGDLCEAQELYDSGRHPEDVPAFISFPEGRVIPVPGPSSSSYGLPVYSDGKLVYLRMDHSERTVSVVSMEPETGTVRELYSMPYADASDGYNLMLSLQPLCLTRQRSGIFEVLWPENVTIRMENTETFCFRDGRDLYFSQWFEDPDYREITVIRDIQTGERRVLPGSAELMPDGTVWYLS